MVLESDRTALCSLHGVGVQKNWACTEIEKPRLPVGIYSSTREETGGMEGREERMVRTESILDDTSVGNLCSGSTAPIPDPTPKKAPQGPPPPPEMLRPCL